MTVKKSYREKVKAHAYSFAAATMVSAISTSSVSLITLSKPKTNIKTFHKLPVNDMVLPHGKEVCCGKEMCCGNNAPTVIVFLMFSTKIHGDTKLTQIMLSKSIKTSVRTFLNMAYTGPGADERASEVPGVQVRIDRVRLNFKDKNWRCCSAR